MEEKIKNVIVWQSLVCPSCKAFIEELPPESWEAISDGDTIKCNHCKAIFCVRFQILAGDEAVEHRMHVDVCPACFGDCERLHNDGLMHKCQVCNGTGKHQ